MKTVLTYGTFDLFHVGHVNLLRRLKEFADRVVVGCSTDEFNLIKGKKSVMPYKHRVAILESVRYVDKVLPEHSWEQKREDILREGADIFAIGEDWAGRFDDLSDICQVVYLPRTQDVSTTDIKQLVHALHQENVAEVRAVVDRLSELVDRL